MSTDQAQEHRSLQAGAYRDTGVPVSDGVLGSFDTEHCKVKTS